MAEDSAPTPRRQHGHSRAYILDRLRRENRTDLAAAVEAGVVSAFSAAVSLGWTKRPPAVGGSDTHQARKRRHRFQALDGSLSAGQLMELQYGPNPSAGSLFGSREELERAWRRSRERLMEGCRPGRRVMGWWEFEATIPYPGRDLERGVLWRSNVLGAEEKAELEAWWRQEFAKAHAPDFFVHTGDEVLHGDAAIEAHLRWADCPRELARRWKKAERRRRARQQAPSAEVVAAK